MSLAFVPGMNEDGRAVGDSTKVLLTVPGAHVSVGILIDCGTVTVGMV